ncbi:hypothetical protein [Streptomyces broussonetiae]|uniref:Uncharacterized protein n=1 Tax=Streptomyces broussonetiae TaxID=2686304 RepID=A0ABV5E8J6_9ACTN
MTEEAATAEAGTDTREAGSTTDEAEVPTGTAEPGEPAVAGAVTVVEETATETAEGSGGDGVDIPKQQSAQAAADNEAGEGART